MEDEGNTAEQEQQHSLFTPSDMKHLQHLSAVIQREGGYGEIRISFFRERVDAISATIEARPGHQYQ